jgi:hypothetical protein
MIRIAPEETLAVLQVVEVEGGRGGSRAGHAGRVERFTFRQKRLRRSCTGIMAGVTGSLALASRVQVLRAEDREEGGPSMPHFDQAMHQKNGGRKNPFLN